jgi:hypothetical protein
MKYLPNEWWVYEVCVIKVGLLEYFLVTFDYLKEMYLVFSFFGNGG